MNLLHDKNGLYSASGKANDLIPRIFQTEPACLTLSDDPKRPRRIVIKYHENSTLPTKSLGPLV